MKKGDIVKSEIDIDHVRRELKKCKMKRSIIDKIIN